MSPKITFLLALAIVVNFDLRSSRAQIPGAPLLAAFARSGGFRPNTPEINPPETTATLNESLPAGAMQQKATTACLECHEARIILQQRLSKATWTKEVDKMVKWGAVVDAADRDALIDYLSENFSPDKPPYIPPRTSKEKISGKSRTN